MEPNKILIVGNDETKDSLRAIKEALKRTGIVASCYFNDDIKRAADYLPDVGFVLLGLSRAGREPSSPQHALEKGLLDKVAAMDKPLPCGVIRDCDGYISAQHLVKHGGLMRLVCTDAYNGQPIPIDLFNGFKLLTIKDVAKLADEIAEEIRSILHVTPVTI